jgi:hypothetical protein
MALMLTKEKMSKMSTDGADVTHCQTLKKECIGGEK